MNANFKRILKFKTYTKYSGVNDDEQNIGMQRKSLPNLIKFRKTTNDSKILYPYTRFNAVMVIKQNNISKIKL